MIKQLTALTLTGLLVFASCQKQQELTNGKDISYTEADFIDNEIIDPSANKNPDRHSNLKVVIRQVNNAENTYRLVLKVDSVGTDLDGDGVEEMVPLGEAATIEAGLSLPDPQNPDDALVIFNPDGLTFRKQNENGYYVFVSDAFTSDIDFDYELVGVQYRITPRWTHVAVTHKIAGSGQYFILPNGKSIEQAPKVTNFRAKGPGRAGAGSSAVFGAIRLTTFDDPMGEVSKLGIFAIVAAINDAKEKTQVRLEGGLVPVGVGNKLGVTIWANENCLGAYDEKNNQWNCEDVLLRPYTNFAVLLDASYILVSTNDGGNTKFPLCGEDINGSGTITVCGTTDHF